MGILLWILQVILCIKFISVAVIHGFGSGNAEMQKARLKLGKASRPVLALTALGTFLGSICLILPVVVKDLAWLVPWAAAWLALMLLFSIGLHLVSREKPKLWADLVLFAMAAFIAFGRWMIAPI